MPLTNHTPLASLPDFPVVTGSPAGEQDLEGQPSHLGAAAPVQNLTWLHNHCAAATPTAYGWGGTSHTPFPRPREPQDPDPSVSSLLKGRQPAAEAGERSRVAGAQHLGPERLDSNLRSSTH